MPSLDVHKSEAWILGKKTGLAESRDDISALNLLDFLVSSFTCPAAVTDLAKGT